MHGEYGGHPKNMLREYGYAAVYGSGWDVLGRRLCGGMAMADAGGGGALRDGNGAFCGGSPAAEVVVAGNEGGGGGGGDGGSSSAAAAEVWKEWDERATAMLLDLYTERYLALQRGTLRAKEWQEVVEGLNAHCAGGRPVYNYNRCKNKIDSLKKTYKTVREKRRLGAPFKWKWYNRIERISSKGGGGGGTSSAVAVVAAHHENGGGLQAAAAADGRGKRLRVSLEGSEQSGFGDQEFGSEGLGTTEDSMQVSLVNLNGIHEDPMLIRSSSFCNAGVTAAGNLRFGLVNGAAAAAAIAQNSSPQQQQQQMPWPPSNHKEMSSSRASKKKRKGSAPSSSASDAAAQQAKEVAQMMIDALERMEQRRQQMEEKRMEMMRELQMKRTETHLQIARMIIESNMQNQARFFNARPSPNPGDS